MSRRIDRIADLIRAELSALLRQRVRDPRIRLATVTAVELTGDLKRAVVRVSVLGEEEARIEAVRALEHARGFLRSELALRLSRLKTTPELVFQLDRGAEHSQRIADLLESLHGNDESA